MLFDILVTIKRTEKLLKNNYVNNLALTKSPQPLLLRKKGLKVKFQRNQKRAFKKRLELLICFIDIIRCSFGRYVSRNIIRYPLHVFYLRSFRLKKELKCNANEYYC